MDLSDVGKIKRFVRQARGRIAAYACQAKKLKFPQRTYKKSSALNLPTNPLKPSFLVFFRDAILRIHVHHSNLLSHLAAFNLAENMPIVTEDEDLLREEELYCQIPLVYRRFASTKFLNLSSHLLLQHLILLIVNEIECHVLIGNLIQICIKNNHIHQAWCLFEKLHSVLPPVTTSDFKNLHLIAKQMKRESMWVNLVCGKEGLNFHHWHKSGFANFINSNIYDHNTQQMDIDSVFESQSNNNQNSQFITSQQMDIESRSNNSQNSQFVENQSNNNQNSQFIEVQSNINNQNGQFITTAHYMSDDDAFDDITQSSFDIPSDSQSINLHSDLGLTSNLNIPSDSSFPLSIRSAINEKSLDKSLSHTNLTKNNSYSNSVKLIAFALLNMLTNDACVPPKSNTQTTEWVQFLLSHMMGNPHPCHYYLSTQALFMCCLRLPNSKNVKISNSAHLALLIYCHNQTTLHPNLLASFYSTTSPKPCLPKLINNLLKYGAKDKIIVVADFAYLIEIFLKKTKFNPQAPSLPDIFWMLDELLGVGVERVGVFVVKCLLEVFGFEEGEKKVLEERLNCLEKSVETLGDEDLFDKSGKLDWHYDEMMDIWARRVRVCGNRKDEDAIVADEEDYDNVLARKRSFDQISPKVNRPKDWRSSNKRVVNRKVFGCLEGNSSNDFVVGKPLPLTLDFDDEEDDGLI